MTTQQLRSVATGKKGGDNAVAAFSGFLDKLKPQMALALPKHMNADRMARLALTAFSTNPDLQACTPQSIAGSIMTAAQLGLEPGIGGQGYLIPYKGVCSFVPGWRGLVDLVSRSGRATVWTGIVREGDEFAYQLGDAPFCRHVPGEADESEDWTHVYAIGRVKDAAMPVIEVWSKAKVAKHLKKFNRVGQRHYALASAHNMEMYARKVALLQVLKYMPASIELANAIDIDNAAEAGKGAVLEGNFVTVVEPPAGSDADQVDQTEGLGARTPRTVAQVRAAIEGAKDRDDAAVILDEARSEFAGDDLAGLAAAFAAKWEV